jgi:adenylate cyclase
MTSTPTRGWYLVWPAFIIAAGLVLHVFNPAGLTSRIQDLSLGVFERYKPRTPAPAMSGIPPVRYVDIGAESLRSRGPWPWPRSDIARLVGLLGEAGAKAVVLDLPLEGRDPVSPGRLAQGLPETADGMALRATYGLLPDPDLALAGAMTRTPVVTRFAPLDLVTAADPKALGDGLKTDPRAERWLSKIPGAEPPYGPLAEKSAGLGAGLISRSDDSVYRLPLVVNVAGTIRPTLLLEAARVALGAPPPEVEAFEPVTPQDKWLGRPGPATVKLGAIAIPITRDGELVFHASANPPPALSAASILAGAQSPDVKDSVVIVGASGAGLAPSLRSPTGPVLAPSAVLAEGLGQILSQSFVNRPLWADMGEELFIFVSGLAICLLLLHAPLAWPILTGTAAIAGAGALGWLAFSRELWFLDPLLPGLTIGAALVLGVHGRLQAERDAEAAETPLSGLISTPQASSGKLPALKPVSMGNTGERRRVTVLACEIHKFHEIMQRYEPDPSALTRLIAAYHETVSDVVLRNKGAIAVLRGPYILAYWNGATADAEHAASACNCALRLIGALEKMNESLSEDARTATIAFEPVEIGVGIETGECIIGQTTAGRPELIAVGPTVTLAELLRDRSAAYGPPILVGENARSEADKLFALLEIDFLRVPEMGEPLHIYALMGNPLVRASPKFRALETTHQEIFQAYRAQNWALARALVDECRRLPAASSQLYDIYESRISELERIPPGPGWDGAHVLEAA